MNTPIGSGLQSGKGRRKASVPLSEALFGLDDMFVCMAGQMYEFLLESGSTNTPQFGSCVATGLREIL